MPLVREKASCRTISHCSDGFPTSVICNRQVTAGIGKRRYGRNCDALREATCASIPACGVANFDLVSGAVGKAWYMRRQQHSPHQTCLRLGLQMLDPTEWIWDDIVPVLLSRPRRPIRRPTLPKGDEVDETCSTVQNGVDNVGTTEIERLVLEDTMKET